MSEIIDEVERVGEVHNFTDAAIERAKPLAVRKYDNGWEPIASAAFSALAEVSQ